MQCTKYVQISIVSECEGMNGTAGSSKISAFPTLAWTRTHYLYIRYSPSYCVVFAKRILYPSGYGYGYCGLWNAMLAAYGLARERLRCGCRYS